MRAELGRTLFDPGFDMRTQCCRVTLIARQCIRLRKRRYVQMAARLPEIFDVADETLVAIVECRCVLQRRLALRQRIAIPLRRMAELAVIQIENRVAALDDALGAS